MESNFDLKIKKIASEEKVILSSSYISKLNAAIEVLDRAHAQRKQNISKYKIAAILAFLLLAGISVSAVAAVTRYYERMEQLAEQEKNKLNEEVQNSDANADSYSREFTSGERERIGELTEQYENMGVFPQSALLQITDTSQIAKDKVCFISETSTFYFPEREMTNEELLEIIDFWHKRDFSVTEKNQGIAAEAQKKETNSNSDLTKQEAEQLAAELVSKILMTNMSGYDKSAAFNSITDSEGGVLSQYMVALSRTDTATKYYVLIDGNNGEMNEIQLMDSPNSNSPNSNYKDGVDFNKEICIKNKSLVDSILKDGLNLSQEDSTCYLGYNLAPNGKLAKGIVTYTVKKTNDSGYVFRYSFNMERIYDILYVPSFQEYEKLNKAIEEKQKESGIVHKSLLLEQ